MPGVEPVRKRNSSLREITVRRDSGRPPDTDERVEQMARLIAGPVPCWCPDDWREPFDKAACPLHGGQEWPAGFHRERVREFLATDAPSPSPPEPAPDVDAIIDRLPTHFVSERRPRYVTFEDAVAAVREAASPSASLSGQDETIPGPDPGACPDCGGWRKAGMVHRCPAATPDPPREEWRVVDGDNVVCRLAGHRDFGTFRPWAEEQCRGLVERFPGESFRIERRVGDEEWEAWCPPDTPMGSCVPRCGDARCEAAAGRAAATPDPPVEPWSCCGQTFTGTADFISGARSAHVCDDAIRADERERLSARVYENGWCPTCAATAAPASPDERLREAGDLAPNEGVWPDQSAMHGVLLEQVKDAYTEGITDTVAKLRVRAANMLPEVASFTMDEIEAILGHAAPGICCAPHCWNEYGTPCGDCPADAEREAKR